VDRIALRAYFPMGQSSGGFLKWWNSLNADTVLSQEQLRRRAGDFVRRVRAFCRKRDIPIQCCQIGDKTKHARAEKLLPKDPDFQGIFLILIAKAPALVWQIRKNSQGSALAASTQGLATGKPLSLPYSG
jgi:hypothetical protein